MMKIIFSSVKQDIHYLVICKSTDKFVNVELKLLLNEFSNYILNSFH